MKKNTFSLLFLILFLFSFHLFSWGSDRDSKGNALIKENSRLKARITELEKKVSSVESQEARIAELEAKINKLESQEERLAGLESKIKGLKTESRKEEPKKKELVRIGESDQSSVAFSSKQVSSMAAEPSQSLLINGASHFVLQGVFNANNMNKKGQSTLDGEAAAHILFQKTFGDYGRALIHLEAGDGLGAAQHTELYSGINTDMDYTDKIVELNEAFAEGYHFDKQLIVTLGKIDATKYVDQNAIADDADKHFLAEIFTFAPTIDYPSGRRTFGARALIAPKAFPWIEFEGQLLDGKNDFSSMTNHLMTTAQIVFKPVIFGLDGTYRFYNWIRRSNYTRWLDPSSENDYSYGFGTSVAQKINEYLEVFGRYSWKDPRFYDSEINETIGNNANFSIEHTWSSGFRIPGELWGRDYDHFAAAIGMNIPSLDYIKSDISLKDYNETQIEIYYSFALTRNLIFSPHFQIVHNPFGRNNFKDNERMDETIYAVGLRGEFLF